MSWKKFRQHTKAALFLMGLPSILLANSFPIYYTDTLPTQQSSSFTLDNNLFGIHGPLSIGTTYSQQYGVILNAQYTQLLSASNAISALVNGGAEQKRVNLTWANQLSEHQDIKFSAERLWQRMDFGFASGDVHQWVGQNAAGATYAYWFDKSWLSDVNANISYSKADSKDLSTLDFSQDGNEFADFRHIAGGTDKSSSVGFDTLPTQSTQLGFQLNYDNVHYDSRYQDTTSQAAGLGLTVNLEQLLTKKVKIDFIASDRKTYNQYGAQLGILLPSPHTTNLELDLGAQRTQGHDGLPNDTAYTANMDLRWGNTSNNTGFSLANHTTSEDLKSWAAKPAVEMSQVLAVKDEKLVQLNQAQAAPTPLQTSTNHGLYFISAQPGQKININLNQYFSAQNHSSTFAHVFNNSSQWLSKLASNKPLNAILSNKLSLTSQDLPQGWQIDSNNNLTGITPSTIQALNHTKFTISAVDGSTHSTQSDVFELIYSAANGCVDITPNASYALGPYTYNVNQTFSINIGTSTAPVDGPSSKTTSIFLNSKYFVTSPSSGRISNVALTGVSGLNVSSSLPNSITISGAVSTPGTYNVGLVASSSYCTTGSDPKTFTLNIIGAAPPVVSNPGNQTVQIGAKQQPYVYASSSITNPSDSGNLNAPTVTYDGAQLANDTYNTDGIKYTYTGSAQSGSITFTYNNSSPAASAKAHTITITSSNTVSKSTTISYQLTILPAAQAPQMTNPGAQTVQIGAKQQPYAFATSSVTNPSYSGNLNTPTVTYDGAQLTNDTYNADGIKYTYTGSAQSGSIIFTYNNTSPAASAKDHTITITSTNTATSTPTTVSYQLTILPAAQTPQVTNPGPQTVQIGAKQQSYAFATSSVTNPSYSGNLNTPTVTYDGAQLTNDTYNADGIKYTYTGSAQSGSIIFTYNNTSPAASAKNHTITITSTNTATSTPTTVSYQLTILPAAQAPTITNVTPTTAQIQNTVSASDFVTYSIQNAQYSGDIQQSGLTFYVNNDPNKSLPSGIAIHNFSYDQNTRMATVTLSYDGTALADTNLNTINLVVTNTVGKSSVVNNEPLTIITAPTAPTITNVTPTSAQIQNTIATQDFVTYTIQNGQNSGDIQQSGLNFYINNDPSKPLPNGIAIHNFSYNQSTKLATVTLSYNGTALSDTNISTINLVVTNTIGKSSVVNNEPLTVLPAPAAPTISASPSLAEIQETVPAPDFVTYTIQNAPASGDIQQSGLKFYMNNDPSKPLPANITIHQFSYNQSTGVATVTLSYDGTSLADINLNVINLAVTNTMGKTSTVSNEPVNVTPAPAAPVIQTVTPSSAVIQNTVASADFVTYKVLNAPNSKDIQQSGLSFYINNDPSKPLPTNITVQDFSYDSSSKIATFTLSYDGKPLADTNINAINLIVTNGAGKSSTVNSEPLTVLPAPAAPIISVTPSTAQLQNTVAAPDFVTYTIQNAPASGDIQPSGLKFYVNNDPSRPLPSNITVHQFSYDQSTGVAIVTLSYDGTPLADINLNTINLVVTNTVGESSTVNSEPLTVAPAPAAPVIINATPSSVVIQNTIASPNFVTYTVQNAPNSGDIQQSGLHFYVNGDTSKSLPNNITIQNFSYDQNTKIATFTLSYDGTPLADTNINTINLVVTNEAGKSSTANTEPLTVLPTPSAPNISVTPATAQIQNTVAAPDFITYTIQNAQYSGYIARNGLHFYVNNDPSKPLPANITIHQFSYDPNSNVATVTLSYDGTALADTNINTINLVVTNSMDQSSAINNEPLTILQAPAAPTISASPATAQIQNSVASTDFVTYTIQNAPNSGTIDQSGLNFYINGNASQSLPESISVHQFSYNQNTGMATVTLSYDGTPFQATDINTINLVVTNSMGKSSAAYNEPLTISPAPSGTRLFCPNEIDPASISSQGDINYPVQDSKGNQYTLQGNDSFWLAGYQGTPQLYDVYINAAAPNGKNLKCEYVVKQNGVMVGTFQLLPTPAAPSNAHFPDGGRTWCQADPSNPNKCRIDWDS